MTPGMSYNITTRPFPFDQTLPHSKKQLPQAYEKLPQSQVELPGSQKK